MPGPLLYSTNPFLKLLIQEKYRKNVHYVWCSEAFDSTKHGTYTSIALVPPSSDPCAIYKQLRDEAGRGERHSSKIPQMKASLQGLAIAWRDANEITAEEAEEIIYMAETAGAIEWRPLVYVIPRAAVQARLMNVPMAKRASLGPEYILSDLSRDEFDVIEL
ncbi:hypothetical protein [Caballeronia sp. M23-90]